MDGVDSASDDTIGSHGEPIDPAFAARCTLDASLQPRSPVFETPVGDTLAGQSSPPVRCTRRAKSDTPNRMLSFQHGWQPCDTWRVTRPANMLSRILGVIGSFRRLEGGSLSSGAFFRCEANGHSPSINTPLQTTAFWRSAFSGR